MVDFTGQALKAWERRQAVYRERMRGRTLADIGQEFGTSKERVRQMVHKVIRGDPKPFRGRSIRYSKNRPGYVRLRYAL